MKSDHLKESRNIEDRRGQSYSQSSGNSNLGGGILQILLSPGSFKSKIVLILLLVLLGGGGASLGGLFGNGTSSQPYQSTQVTRTTRPMSTMQMPSSSARSLEQQKIIGTRSFKLKDVLTMSPNQSSIPDGHRQAVGLGKHRLVPSTVRPTKRFIWI